MLSSGFTDSHFIWYMTFFLRLSCTNLVSFVSIMWFLNDIWSFVMRSEIELTGGLRENIFILFVIYCLNWYQSCTAKRLIQFSSCRKWMPWAEDIHFVVYVTCPRDQYIVLAGLKIEEESWDDANVWGLWGVYTRHMLLSNIWAIWNSGRRLVSFRNKNPQNQFWKIRQFIIWCLPLWLRILRRHKETSFGEEDTLRKWYLVDWKEVFFQKSTHFEEVISCRLEFFLLSAAEKHEGSLGISRLEEFNWFLLA